MKNHHLANQLHNKALDQQENNNLDEAVTYYKKAISLNPKQWESALNLSNILLSKNDFKHAERVLKKALSYSKNEVPLLLSLSNIYKQQDKINDALDISVKTYSLAPENEFAKINLASLFLLTNQIKEANSIFSAASKSIDNPILLCLIYLSHTYSNNKSNLATFYKGIFNSAYENSDIQSLKKFILGQLPKGTNTNCYLFRLFENIREFLSADDTKWLLNNGLSQNGKCHHLLQTALGISYKLDAELDLAIGHLYKSLKSNPSIVTTKVHLADVLFFQGRINEAKSLLKEVKKTTIFTQLNALLLLEQHSFSEAWSIYNKWQKQIHKPPSLTIFDQEELKESPSNVLICRDQGIGDEIMFMSCLEDFLSSLPLTTSITLACSQRLHPLIKNLSREVNLADGGNNSDLWNKSLLKSFDSCIRLSQLPSFVRLSCSDFKPSTYLHPDEKLVSFYKHTLKQINSKYKIGIAWKGGEKPLYKKLKAIPFSDFLPLFKLPNTSFVNLQYGDVSEEIEWLKSTHDITLINFNNINPLKDLSEQAALIKSLDLVVQISNTSIHLSGALGTKSICILPQNHDFRWFKCSEDTPPKSAWYANVEMHIKHESETWPESISRLASKIKSDLFL